SFKSTAIKADDAEEFEVVGELTLRGVTKEVAFATEFAGVATDPNGNQVAGLSATGTVNRKDFGMSFDAVLGGGELLVSDKIKIELELELVKAGLARHGRRQVNEGVNGRPCGSPLRLSLPGRDSAPQPLALSASGCCLRWLPSARSICAPLSTSATDLQNEYRIDE